MKQNKICLTIFELCMLTCLLASLLLLCSCSLERGAVNEWGEASQRELAGLFTGQWYDYYLRGLTRAQLNSWEEAAADFREAVAGRDRDQRRARTYGMHFIDYFPHRELGIAWYRIGRYEEAQTELERSLAQIETSKAKYYLNKTRRALLQAAGNDSQPPAISLDSLPEGLVTNRHRMTIVGTASDAGYSGSVSVNNLPQFVELAEQVLAFSEEVMIKPGPNNITVTAADLMGNVAEKKITVKGDFSGPLIAFDNVAGGDQVSAERFVLRGELADAGGLAALQVNGRQTCYNRTSQAAFAVELELIKGINPISVLATDVVGNTTAVTLELAYSPATALASPVMLAAATDSILDTGQSMFFARAHGALPRIELRGIQDQQVTCFDEFLFEGSVRSGEGVHDIRINGSSIMSAAGSTGIAGTLKDLAVGLRKSVAFSRIVPLQEGRNTIRIVAVDGRDRTVTKNITVTKKTPRVKQLGSRLSLSVFPFTESDPERKLVKYVRALLQQALVSQKRFNVVERDALDRLLEEQQLTQGAVFDRDTTIRLGRLMASETMLLGDVFTTDTSVEIITRLVDTDTSVILAEKDIYWEGDDRTVTREAMRGLALKYKQHFPLCEGTVVKVDGDQVTINLGLDSRLFEGIRLLAYSGADAERDTELLGIVSAKQVGSDFARCSTVELFGEKRLQLRTKVMVK